MKLRRLCFYRCLSVHRGEWGWCYPSMPCRWYPSMPFSRSRGRGGYPSMPARFPGPQPRGKLRGIWSRPTAKGEVEGDLARGCLLLGDACSRGGACSGGCACSWGCLLPGEVGGDHPASRRLLLHTVRILLECILVTLALHRIGYCQHYLFNDIDFMIFIP